MKNNQTPKTVESPELRVESNHSGEPVGSSSSSSSFSVGQEISRMRTWTRTRKTDQLAFTLVELLVVISIIAVLAAFTIPVLNSLKRTQNLKQTQAEMANLETAIDSFKAAYGFYPPSNAGYNPGNPLTRN